MNISIEDMNILLGITRYAENSIKEKTGLAIQLVIKTKDSELRAPREIMKHVASILKLQYADYAKNDRRRVHVDLRRIAAVLVREYCSGVTLKELGKLMGDYDHTTVCNWFSTHENLMATVDDAYVAKFESVKNELFKWIEG